MYIGWRNKDKRKQAFVSFGRKNDERNQIQIEADQSSDLILERMKEVVSGKRDKLYLTRGMGTLMCLISEITNGNYLMSLIFLSLR